MIYWTFLWPMWSSPPFYQVSLVAQLVKKSTCNAGDPSLIPGSGRSPGEGIGYPLQYSWASLVAQLVKNLPAVQETWFDPWVGKIPLEKEMATHSRILAWVANSRIWLSNFHFHFVVIPCLLSSTLITHLISWSFEIPGRGILVEAQVL